MVKFAENYQLNRENIDIISEKAREICQSIKLASDQTIRVRLLLEEVLLEWFAKEGDAAEIEFKFDTHFFRPFFSVSYASKEARNPLNTDEYEGFLKTTFEQLTFAPEYNYERGRNTVNIRLRKPNKNPILKILSIVLCSCIFGFLGQFVLPLSVINTLQENIIVPTYKKFLEILGCVASPMIFFSVAWGLYGIGDTATLSKLGKKMILYYLRDVLIAVVLCVLLIPAFGCVISGKAVDFTQILSVYTMFLDMLPNSVVEPFVVGNTIQIIVLAIVVGIALLCLGKKTRYVAVAVEQINLITNFLMEVISKIVPFFIILVLINMVWSNALSILANSWNFILILLIALLGIILLSLISVSIRNRVKISLLVKKSMPSFLIALTTASSTASFGAMMKNCEQEFGINGSLVSFGVPLGLVLHKVASGINCILIAFYISGLYQIEISLSWIIMAVIISVITAIATPVIPGGAIISYTMLFSQLGLPGEGLAIILAIDVVTDFLISSTNVFCLPLALVNVAGRYGLLDLDTLRK